jgi:predicted HNH restriction endonuclease
LKNGGNPRSFNWYEEEEDSANLAALCSDCHKQVHDIKPIEIRQHRLDFEKPHN